MADTQARLQGRAPTQPGSRGSCLAGGFLGSLSDSLPSLVIPAAGHHVDLYWSDPAGDQQQQQGSQVGRTDSCDAFLLTDGQAELWRQAAEAEGGLSMHWPAAVGISVSAAADFEVVNKGAPMRTRAGQGLAEHVATLLRMHA